MGRLGLGELLLILVIVLLFVGSKRLPELARSVGQAIREFQKSLKGGPHNKHDEH